MDATHPPRLGNWGRELKMNIQITHQSAGKFSTHVSFRADGVPHAALIYANPEKNKLFAFGAEGDDCVTTHQIDNKDMLAALLAALA